MYIPSNFQNILMKINHPMVEIQPLNGYISDMIYRNITPAILQALEDTPVIFINGARQTGKSTLVKWLAKYKYPAQYYSLDDLSVLASIKQSPIEFIDALSGPVIIDEIQKAPELFPVIKTAVDNKRTPGRFILTGSANVLLLPTISESLVGRMEIVTLWPFSQSEIESHRSKIIDHLFDKKWVKKISSKQYKLPDLKQRVRTGGYPEVFKRNSKNRQNAWFNSYITTLVQRDIRELAKIDGLTTLPHLLSLVASRATTLLNFADFSRITSIPQSTLKRYLSLFEMTFLIFKLPAWTTNIGKRLLKSPKMIVNDSGLLSYLMQFDPEESGTAKDAFGPVLENFVITELKKESTWSETKPEMFHFRTTSGIEVDLVLENRRRQLVGIEIKSKSLLNKHDLKGIRYLKEVTKERFLQGFVFYTGNHILPMGDDIFALPISLLWNKNE